MTTPPPPPDANPSLQQAGVSSLVELIHSLQRLSSFQRIHLNISSGEDAIDYFGLAHEEHMDIDSLQMRIRQLNNQVVQMRREQDYQRVCVCGALCLSLLHPLTPGPRLMMGYSAQLPYQYQSISVHTASFASAVVICFSLLGCLCISYSRRT